MYIPQSKIKDFCQPPLGKGAFGAAFKLLYKLEFVCDIITERKDSVGIINRKREEACLFAPLPIEYTQPGIPGGKE